MSQRELFDQYIGSLFAENDPILTGIIREAEQQQLPQINVQPYEGYMLGWLVRLISAKHAVEIGTLAGYSGTWIARSLPVDGVLHTIESEQAHAAVARRSFEKAGLSQRVQIHVGDALEVLKLIVPEGPFDFVFIDADRKNYPTYLAWAVENLRPGGLVAAHNAYRRGGVLSPASEEDEIVDAFNRSLNEIEQIDPIIIPMGDGLAVAIRC